MFVTVAKTIAWVALLAACLFGPSGDVGWSAAWGVLTIYAAVIVAAILFVDHGLLAERTRPAAGSDRLDAWYAILGVLLLYPATLLAAGMEHAQVKPTAAPGWWSVVGLKLFSIGYVLVLWAMATNRFFTTIVRVQRDRGHHVVDRGPYAWLRHPGYTGTIAAHLALPLALDSWWAVAPAVIGSLLFIPRAIFEERTLTAGLPGYAAYRDRVGWRLLPGIW